MEWVSEITKSGYSIFTNTQGEEYLVIRGLDPNQIHTPGVIETFLVENYALLALGYWILLFATFAYLIIKFIYLPLRARRAAGLPLFAEE